MEFVSVAMMMGIVSHAVFTAYAGMQMATGCHATGDIITLDLLMTMVIGRITDNTTGPASVSEWGHTDFMAAGGKWFRRIRETNYPRAYAIKTNAGAGAS